MPAKWSGKKIRAEVYNRDKMTCCYCGIQCLPYSELSWRHTPKQVVTLDHIVSQWKIAQTVNSDQEFKRAIKDASNLVVVCNGCNSSKKNTPLYIWCKRKGFDYVCILARIVERTGKNLC